MGCKFCHLTQNQDTMMNHVDISTYSKQIRVVLEHYRQQRDQGLCQVAKRCNINFMAKGDAMANKNVINKYSQLWQKMNNVCQEFGTEIFAFASFAL